MRRIIPFLLFAVLAFTTDSFADASKLTLVFSGNTEAEVRPCPT